MAIFFFVHYNWRKVAWKRRWTCTHALICSQDLIGVISWFSTSLRYTNFKFRRLGKSCLASNSKSCIYFTVRSSESLFLSLRRNNGRYQFIVRSNFSSFLWEFLMNSPFIIVNKLPRCILGCCERTLWKKIHSSYQWTLLKMYILPLSK